MQDDIAPLQYGIEDRRGNLVIATVRQLLQSRVFRVSPFGAGGCQDHSHSRTSVKLYRWRVPAAHRHRMFAWKKAPGLEKVKISRCLWAFEKGMLDNFDMIAEPGSTDWSGSRSWKGTDA
jgi:hypothetical protein